MEERLTDEYYKARRQLVLFSALLLVWQLVGVELDPETPLPYLNVTLKSPEAAPWILVALVVYFALRASVEWFQSSPNRRREPASRADAVLTGLIPGMALFVFAVQTTSQVQLVDLVNIWSASIFFLGHHMGMNAALAYLYGSASPREGKTRVRARRMAFSHAEIGLLAVPVALFIVLFRVNTTHDVVVAGDHTDVASTAILLPSLGAGLVVGLITGYLSRFFPWFARNFRSIVTGSPDAAQ